MYIKRVNNNNKMRKKNQKNSNPFDINDKILICKVFLIKNNKICYKKFAKKGNYCLPAIIEGILHLINIS